MTGTPNQVELANLIKLNVAEAFDRVDKVLQEAAARQPEGLCGEITDLIAIVEEKRAAVLTKSRAGEFIRDWQEPDGKVAKLIADDPRCQAIRARRKERHAAALV